METQRAVGNIKSGPTDPSIYDEPFEVCSDVIVDGSMILPFPLQEAPAVPDVGLLRFPSVTSQPQFRFEPIEDGNFILR